MHLTRSTVLLAIVHLNLAADCTVPRSTPWPFEISSDGSSDGSSGGSSGGSSSGGDSITDICAQFKNDAAEYQACTESALSGQCNAVGCPDSTDITGSTDDLISSPGDDLISSGSDDDSGLIKKLRARDTLTCSSSETCYQHPDNSLLCYNPATGYYHDDIGGTGNYFDGTYTEPDEDTKDETTGTTTATSAAAASSTSTSGTSAAVASATSDSGGINLRAGALVGVFRLLSALVW